MRVECAFAKGKIGFQGPEDFRKRALELFKSREGELSEMQIECAFD